jgi:hypothetical protein
MPSLRNILHKRDELTDNENETPTPPTPEFKLIRSDTHTQEIITPPSDPTDGAHLSSPTQESRPSFPPRRSFQLFNRTSRAGSASSQSPPRRERSLSNLLRLDSRSRSNSRDSSANIPADLPQIEDDQGATKQEREAQWEKRATVLVQGNPQFGHSGSSLSGQGEESLGLGLGLGKQARSRSSSQSALVVDPDTDVGCVIYIWNVGLISRRSIFKRQFGYMKRGVSLFPL